MYIVGSNIWEGLMGDVDRGIFGIGDFELIGGGSVLSGLNNMYLRFIGSLRDGSKIDNTVHVGGISELHDVLVRSGFVGVVGGLELLLRREGLYECLWSGGVMRSNLRRVIEIGGIGYSVYIDWYGSCDCGRVISDVNQLVDDLLVTGVMDLVKYSSLCDVCRRRLWYGVIARMYSVSVKWVDGYIGSLKVLLGVSGSLDDLTIDERFISETIGSVVYRGELYWLPAWYISEFNGLFGYYG